MQYVELGVVRYAASILGAADEAGHMVYCEAQPCEKPVAYLVPDATPAGGGGQDVEQRPAMFCREHLEEMLGHPPEEQPFFHRREGSNVDPEV